MYGAVPFGSTPFADTDAGSASAALNAAQSATTSLKSGARFSVTVAATASFIGTAGAVLTSSSQATGSFVGAAAATFTSSAALGTNLRSGRKVTSASVASTNIRSGRKFSSAAAAVVAPHMGTTFSSASAGSATFGSGSILRTSICASFVPYPAGAATMSASCALSSELQGSTSWLEMLRDASPMTRFVVIAEIEPKPLTGRI